MSVGENDLSGYRDYLKTMSNNYALFAGFTFTAITVLITRLPDLSQSQSQIMLFRRPKRFCGINAGLSV